MCSEETIVVLLILILKPAGTQRAGTSVTFENSSYCASKGSAVELGCSFSYPAGDVVTNTAWYKGRLKDNKWSRVALRRLSSYQNRSEYLGDKQRSCNLAIHRLQLSDSGYYYFRFDTDWYGWRSRASTHLLVTELKARLLRHRVSVGDTVSLHCQADCRLSAIVWFKNGQRVTRTEFRAQAEDSGKYACAAEGQESAQSPPVSLDVQYAPFNVSAEVSPAGVLTVGGAVNLTCVSVANPAAERHAWFRVVSGARLQVSSGQVLRRPSVDASDAGLYFCQAWNGLGENNSTAVLLTVDRNYSTRFILFTGIAVKVTVLLSLALVCFCVRRCSSAEKKKRHSHDYENVRTRRCNPPADTEDHDYENEPPANRGKHG